jgi:CRP-like cAMP-binding protein
VDRTSIEPLRRVSLFADLDEPQLEELALHSRRRRFGANEALFHLGDPGHTLYVILSGCVRIQSITPSGETIHLALRGPGEHVGELALIDGKPRMADAVTTEPSDLLMLDRNGFVSAIEASPRMALAVMSVLADRLRQAAGHLEEHQELDVLGRVAAALLKLTEAHGTPDPAGGTRIEANVTQKQLAEQVAATRESVNRALASLKEARTIRMDGRTIVVTNVKKLSQHCGR